MKTYPAQLVFMESLRGGRWFGRLLNRGDACDTQRDGRLVTGVPRFDITESNGRFHAIMQGAGPGSRRYRTYASLTEAQIAGVRWAGRRFRIPVEEK